MILNQTDFFARSATLDGAISDTDTQITLAGLSTRFTDAVAAGTVRYPIGPFRISDDDGFELIAITGHVSGSTFEVDRGIQRTSEEAWPDETAVRAVVTGRQMVEREYIYSNNLDPSKASYLFVDTFNREDGPLGQAYSGESWTVVNGSIAIVSRQASASGESGAIVPIPNLGSSAYRMRVQLQFAGTSTNQEGVYVFYKDADNHIRFGIASHRGRGEITTTIAGEQVRSDFRDFGGGALGRFESSPFDLDVWYSPNNNGHLAFHYWGDIYRYSMTEDEATLINESGHIGLYTDQSTTYHSINLFIV